MHPSRHPARTPRPARRRRSRGVALVIVLFTLVIMALLSAAMVEVTFNTTLFGKRNAVNLRNLQAAQAGAEVTRDAVRNTSNGIAASLTSPTAVVYVVNYSGGNPSLSSDPYYDPGYASEPDAFNPGHTVATGYTSSSTMVVYNSTLGNALPTAAPQLKWVRIALETENSVGQVINSNATLANTAVLFDPSYGRYISGTNAAANGKPLYQIVSYANDQGYTRTVTEEVTSFVFPFSPPAAVTLMGNNPIYGDPHSYPWTVSGIDAASGSTQILPSMGAVGASNASFLASEPFRPDYTHYPGSGGTPPNPAIIDVLAGGYRPTSLNSVPGLLQQVKTIAALADRVCGGSGPACPSSVGDGTGFLDSTKPQITVINGDLNLPLNSGGIVVVTGTVTVPNNVVFNGLLMVIGTGKIGFATNGGGHPNLGGALFLANVCGNTTTPAADLSNCTSMGQSSLTTFNGGGNGGIQFNSALISAAYASRSFTRLSYREG